MSSEENLNEEEDENDSDFSSVEEEGEQETGR